MNHINALEWEMRNWSSEVQFCASREGAGYQLVVKKDGALALAGGAPDMSTLLRRSQQLRSELRNMGYAPSTADLGSAITEALPPTRPEAFLPSVVAIMTGAGDQR